MLVSLDVQAKHSWAQVNCCCLSGPAGADCGCRALNPVPWTSTCAAFLGCLSFHESPYTLTCTFSQSSSTSYLAPM